MEVKVGRTIEITRPPQALVNWINKELKIDNPEYLKRKRLGLYISNQIYKKISLYSQDSNKYILPFGTLRKLLNLRYENGNKVIPNDCLNVENMYRTPVDFGGEVSLYDYQEKAVEKAISSVYGIIQSPTGTGKTQMGLALAQRIGLKTLWLTHTKDLLVQSKQRAEQYFDKEGIGTITEGKVNIGETITFATVQTMVRLNLPEYEKTWDVVIVDECHRVAGSPSSMGQFYKVLNSLSARKYGLSATVHRADGFIESTYAILGGIVVNVSQDEVADKIVQVGIKPIETNFKLNPRMLKPDGTFDFNSFATEISNDEKRKQLVVDKLLENTDHFNLTLSFRMKHLKDMKKMLNRKDSALLENKLSKEAREKVLQDMREGKIRYLFATFALAKEGLDIPRLDRLYLAFPNQDYGTITQSVGRISRTFKDKKDAIVYDFVDELPYTVRAYKKRKKHYQRLNAYWVEE